MGTTYWPGSLVAPLPTEDRCENHVEYSQIIGSAFDMEHPGRCLPGMYNWNATVSSLSPSWSHSWPANAWMHLLDTMAGWLHEPSTEVKEGLDSILYGYSPVVCLPSSQANQCTNIHTLTVLTALHGQHTIESDQGHCCHFPLVNYEFPGTATQGAYWDTGSGCTNVGLLHRQQLYFLRTQSWYAFSRNNLIYIY